MPLYRIIFSSRAFISRSLASHYRRGLFFRASFIFLFLSRFGSHATTTLRNMCVREKKEGEEEEERAKGLCARARFLQSLRLLLFFARRVAR